MTWPSLSLLLALSHVPSVHSYQKSKGSEWKQVVIRSQGLEDGLTSGDEDRFVVRRGGHGKLYAKSGPSEPSSVAAVTGNKMVGGNVCIGSVAIGDRALRIRQTTIQ